MKYLVTTYDNCDINCLLQLLLSNGADFSVFIYYHDNNKNELRLLAFDTSISFEEVVKKASSKKYYLDSSTPTLDIDLKKLDCINRGLSYILFDSLDEMIIYFAKIHKLSYLI